MFSSPFYLFIYVIVVWSVGAAKAGAIREFGVGGRNTVVRQSSSGAKRKWRIK